MFDTDIPFRDNPSKFEVFSSSLTNMHQVEMVSVMNGYLHFISLLVERGVYSKQPYMANVNHRGVSYLKLNNGEGNNKPLMEAMYSDSPDDTFNTGDVMSYFFHGVVLSGNSVPTRKSGLKTFAPASYPQDHGESIRGSGFIHGLKVCLLKLDHFKRLLRFFNIQWDKVDDDYSPSLYEISSFMSYFIDVDLKTREGMISFLKKFQLETFYAYNDDIAHEDNVSFFGYVLRALVPVRASCFEGQHRWLPMINILHGHYETTADVPLKKRRFSEVFNFNDDTQTRKSEKVCLFSM